MQRATLSMICLVAMLYLGLAVPLASAIEGPMAHATVSFGAWQTDPPLNRFPNVSPAPSNVHELIPSEMKIKVGGAVNFIISGLHQVLVYDDGTTPEDIEFTQTTETTGTPSGVLLIDDANNRIYRGPDPSLLPRDRVEVVFFPHPGTYLVICGVKNHFVDDSGPTPVYHMFGFVTVLP